MCTRAGVRVYVSEHAILHVCEYAYGCECARAKVCEGVADLVIPACHPKMSPRVMGPPFICQTERLKVQDNLPIA